MRWFFDLLIILGSLGFFIFGMKLMSDSIQRVAGQRLRALLSSMTKNRFYGVLTGFITTSIVQSSSATTVMVVSFVNAGLLSLLEATGVIMGANIGTTVTAWIVSFFGFKFEVSLFSLILAGIFFPFLFAKRDNLRNLAEFVFGFGILFQGLQFLKESVPDIRANPEILHFLQPYTEFGYFSVLLFVLVGTFITIIVQSSSATMTITMVAIAQGWLPFDMGAAMVLGENIGTTITANLAAIVGNVHAKRAARFHTLFNLIGVAWMLFIFPYFLHWIDHINRFLFHEHSVFEVARNARDQHLIESTLTDGLALFHTTFNVLNTLLLIGFAPAMARIVTKLTKARSREEEGFRLQYISTGIMSTPELSIEEARKELQSFGKLVEKMNANILILFFKRPKNKEKLYKKIANREEITDRLQAEITNYLARVSKFGLSEKSALQIKGMIRIASELERMADIFYTLSMDYKRLESKRVSLPESLKSNLENFYDLIYRSLKNTNLNIARSPEEINMEAVYESEREINNMRNNLQRLIYDRIEKGQYPVEDGVIFLDFVNAAEKVGDHIVNINQALTGNSH